MPDVVIVKTFQTPGLFLLDVVCMCLDTMTGRGWIADDNVGDDQCTWIPATVLGKMIVFLCRHMLVRRTATSRTVQPIAMFFPSFFVLEQIAFCSNKSCSNTTIVNISRHFSAFNKPDFVSKVTSQGPLGNAKITVCSRRNSCSVVLVLAVPI